MLMSDTFGQLSLRVPSGIRYRAYHIEVFYRLRVSDNIFMTPDFWVILNPENNSKNLDNMLP
ncbi:carbohydrate porin [Anabaena lutea FACHB-196]|uniref:Carbohydrate porin n=2 Tax=Anabaena TaxID=1163 RepID=A0ABR8FMW4_9NOST|nr:carbohydrate porin [Anabaena lutea]MBD2571139.1 carbohydrate porin [Anabaena lutea FACHB-196]